MDRRLFLKGVLATGALSLANLDTVVAREAARISRTTGGATLAKPTKSEQDLAEKLIAHAKSLGATYCDIRLSRTLSQSVSARDAIVTGISDHESYGMGIRVIK